jgi:hypothetical protein
MIRVRALHQRGSALVFGLFACATVMIAIQILAVAVLWSERALADEVAGRQELAAVDSVLGSLRDQTRTQWGPALWEPVESTGIHMSYRLSAPGEGGDWVVWAEVAAGAAAQQRSTTVLVERGRDGVDLPLAAVVARCVRVTFGRETPWLMVEADIEGDLSSAEPAVAYVSTLQGPEILGEFSSLERLEGQWGLGEGWRTALESRTIAGRDVVVLHGEKGSTYPLQQLGGLGTSDRPVLIAITGGADLDATGLGTLWGVILAEGSSVMLDSTVVHGAVFAGETADLGANGQVVFNAAVLAWARDRSLQRARLVPGSRLEETE